MPDTSSSDSRQSRLWRADITSIGTVLEADMERDRDLSERP
jgi:hypothetical protein